MLPVVFRAPINPITGQPAKAVSPTSKTVINVNREGIFKVGDCYYSLLIPIDQSLNSKDQENFYNFFSDKPILRMKYFTSIMTSFRSIDKLTNRLDKAWKNNELAFKREDGSEIDITKFFSLIQPNKVADKFLQENDKAS